VALVLEGVSLRTAVREAGPMRGRQSWWSFIRATKQPELAVVLLGEAASPEEQATIRDTLAATPGIAHLLQLRTMHLAPEELLVAARFELDHDLSGDDAARVIDQAQAQVRQAVPSARIIYLEPELPTAEVPQPGRRSQR
jgi:divalent metal cation (Fe/Co/Zn/Cd) transporter